MEILIVKIGAVGDVVMSLAMLEPLRQKDPEARITWVCGRTVEPLLRATGKIHELVAVDESKLLKGNFFQKALALLSVWARLAGRRFDLAVTGHSDPRYGLLSGLSFAKIRRSFGRGGGRLGPLPGRFHGDEYVRLATGVDGPAALRVGPCELKLPLRAELQREIGRGGKVPVALAPGGAKNVLRDDALRRWPVENYRRLAESLLKDGFEVVLTGSPSDAWVRGAFAGVAAVDLIGKTDLPDLAALYGACRLVVTHDSGPLHLASLAGTPCLALFGPTNPSERVAAGGKTRVLWGGEHLACRPCYDGKDYATCADNLCVKSITVERAYKEASRMLGRV